MTSWQEQVHQKPSHEAQPKACGVQSSQQPEELREPTPRRLFLAVICAGSAWLSNEPRHDGTAIARATNNGHRILEEVHCDTAAILAVRQTA